MLFGLVASSFLKAVGDEGQRVQAGAAGVKDGVTDGRSDSHDGRFAGPCWSDVFTVEENSFDFGDIAEPRNAIARETWVGDTTVSEFDGFKECAAEALNTCADDLVAQTVGIDDSAAFEGGDKGQDSERTGIFVDSD